MDHRPKGRAAIRDDRETNHMPFLLLACRAAAVYIAVPFASARGSMKRHPFKLAPLALALTPLFASAQDQTPPAAGQQSVQPLPGVTVYGQREDTPAKLEHQMPEVAGTQITVTKKTTVTKLDDQPTIIDNNVQQLFARSPGIFVSEQGTPTQFNLSYRGIGNPQEAEYVLVMQDGIPITTDWIGFPTLYYMPQPQGIAEVQEVRGGSSLLYGPEPAPVINFVSRRPQPGEPFNGYSENVIGNHGLFGSYNAIEGTSGPWEYRVAGYYRTSDGQRENSGSQVRGVDAYIGYRPDETQHWGLDLHAYNATAGDAG